MPTPDYIAWIDIETSGSNEQLDLLLEVACIVTDQSLKELGRQRVVIKHDSDHINTVRSRAVQVVRDMHDATGLWDDVSDPKVALMQPYADEQMAAFLDLWVVRPTKAALAGSGVGHFDGRWLRAHMPATAHRLTYWAYDVGVLRRWFARLGIGTPDFNGAKTHRGMDDIECHLAEARWFDEQLGEAMFK